MQIAQLGGSGQRTVFHFVNLPKHHGVSVVEVAEGKNFTLSWNGLEEKLIVFEVDQLISLLRISEGVHLVATRPDSRRWKL